MSTPSTLYERLPNGLTLLLREAHYAPVVEFQVAARVGSADEGAGEAGLAHFHEHMLFKGTERRGVGEIAGEVEGAGGRINAFTSFDATVYHATVPGDGLALAQDVLIDMVRYARFDAEEVAREIEVVLEEIRRSEDSPHSVCGDALFAARYRDHPYGAPILGSAESVASFTPAAIRRFFERWYAPDNVTIVAAGDFDAQALATSLGEAFGDAEPRGARSRRPTEPEQRGLRTALLRRPFERACFEMAWPAPALGDPDTPHLDLLAYVLGEGESSRLVRNVREREGLADRVDAHCYTPRDPGLFGASLDLDAEKACAALGAVVREVERLRCEAVSEDELEIARTNFLASEHFERESVSGVARKLGSFELLAGDYRAEERYLDAIRAATPESLRRVARRYLREDALCVAGVLPEAAVPELDDKAVARAVSEGASATRSRFQVPRPGPREADEIVSYTLASGASLHVEPRPGLSVVAARAACLGGLLSEDETNAGIARFASAMWSRGTRTHSAANWARAVESIAADLDGYSGRSSIGLALEVPSVRIEPALDLFAEALLEPAFDPEELERERRDTLAALARREDRLGARAFDLFTETLWRSHPYRHPIVGREAAIAALTREDLLAYHRRWITGPNLVVGVAGDVDPDRCAEAFATRLADLDATPFELALPPDEPAPDTRRDALLHKDRAQCHLVVGFRGLRVDDADRFALDVLSQLLAGQGGRLFLELRDRQGLAYALNAVNVEGVAPGFFAVSIACAPDKLDAARRGIDEELDRVLQEVPVAAELERARRYLIGTHEIDRQRSASRAAQTALDGRYGLGLRGGSGYPEAIAAVDGGALLRVARRVLTLDARVEAVVRP